MLTPIAYLFGGLILLVLGADSLLRGVTGLALRAGVGAFAVGLTASALGAAPLPVAVTLAAGCEAASGLALGNALGGALAAIGLVLASTALNAALAIRLPLLRLQVGLLGAAASAVLLLGLDGELSRLDGALLIVGVIVWAAAMLRCARQTPPAALVGIAAGLQTQTEVPRNLSRLLLGAALLGFGAHLVVRSGGALGAALAWSPLSAGLVFVAIGVGLPALVMSLIAVRQGQGELAAGNAVGAGLFNLLPGLGGLALLRPLSFSHSLLLAELPLLIGGCAALVWLLRGGRALDRRVAGGLLAGWLALVCFQLWRAGHS